MRAAPTRLSGRAPTTIVAAIACAVAAALAYGIASASEPRPALRQVIVGRSVEGRAIRATIVGDPAAPRSVLVVGCIHGDEPSGEAVTRSLRHDRPPPGTNLWLVDRFNPDGCLAGTRQNAHGVDLNRNSPWHWRPLRGTFYSGPRPLSEPESRAINRLIRKLRPAVSIWYHQHAALVDTGSGGSVKLERRYASIVGLPLTDYGTRPGSITTWQDATFPRDTAFVVELPAGPLTGDEVARHVRAVLALARAIKRG